MKGLTFLVMVLLGAGAAFASVADTAPGAPAVADMPSGGTDTWGLLVRSWSTADSQTYTKTGAACTNDNYYITGPWTTISFFGVYNAQTGSLVRTSSVSGISGYRDGTGRCHLGTGYFVICTGGPGPAVYFTYSAGGNPGSSSAGNLFTCGRGIGWNGTYYYATTGSWSTPIGEYTTTGSLVRSFTTGVESALYGIAAHPSFASYIYCFSGASGNIVTQHYTSSGSRVRSFSAGGQYGGIDAGWSDGYLYCGAQNNYCYVYDGELRGESVMPKSLGTIKAVFR
jgi:hypothetical protein